MARIDTAEAIADAWNRELPGVPTDSIRIITRVWRAAKLLSDERRRTLTGLGIDRATLDLISVLRRRGTPYELTPAELAARSLVSAGAVSQRVARAEEAGLVEVDRTPSGKRALTVRLTERGHAWADHSVTGLLEAEDHLVGHLSERQRADLARLLKAFLAGLHDHTGVPDTADLDRTGS